MDSSELLRYATRLLERLGLRYFVTGSAATIFYGEPRFTNDIDIAGARARPRRGLRKIPFAVLIGLAGSSLKKQEMASSDRETGGPRTARRPPPILPPDPTRPLPGGRDPSPKRSRYLAIQPGPTPRWEAPVGPATVRPPADAGLAALATRRGSDQPPTTHSSGVQ
jgi:hypothetical protein